jgi:hypothetical protein
MHTVEAVIEKKEIPTKSRLAAWWMLIMGGTAVAVCLVMLFVGLWTGGIHDEFGFVFYIFGLAGIAIFIFYLLPGLLILKGGRWGWITASVILSIAIAIGFGIFMYGITHSYHYYSQFALSPEYLFENASNLLYLFPLLIPLTLILLDHMSYKRVALLPIFIVIIYFAGLIIANI